MKQQKVDVIVIMRGGGSLQSLAAFDSEVLVREIVSSPVPVIAAIGHHQDVPLSALAADIMVSTPTAAANLISEHWDDALFKVTDQYRTIMMQYKDVLNDVSTTMQLQQAKIMDKFQTILGVFDYTKEHMNQYMGRITDALRQYTERMNGDARNIFKNMEDVVISRHLELDILQSEKIHRSFLFSLKSTKEKLSLQEKLIEINNPLRQLTRGFSIIHGENGKLVKSIKDVTMGETLTATVSDGEIISTAERVKK